MTSKRASGSWRVTSTESRSQLLPYHGGRVPTCRGVLLCGGVLVLTRGSSSCTISPLAKIRTILSETLDPC